MKKEERVTAITGTIETADGKVTEFQILPESGWTQWGATDDVLEFRVDLLTDMTDAAWKYLDNWPSDDWEDEEE